MAINIKDPATEAAVRELVAYTGGSITEAVKSAVDAMIEIKRQEREERAARRHEAVERILDEMHAAPVNDPRPWREIRDELLDGL